MLKAPLGQGTTLSADAIATGEAPLPVQEASSNAVPKYLDGEMRGLLMQSDGRWDITVLKYPDRVMGIRSVRCVLDLLRNPMAGGMHLFRKI